MWTLRRQAARTVVLDSDDRVLLLQAVDPADPAKGSWWELPGGGIEPGEPSSHAAARELYEETGIVAVEMGRCVWQHRARFRFGGFQFDQQEYIHVARIPGSPLEGAYRPAGLEALEALAFQGSRWWSLPELESMLAAGGRVIPPWLYEQVTRFLDEGPPMEPLDLGDLPDVF